VNVDYASDNDDVDMKDYIILLLVCFLSNYQTTLAHSPLVFLCIIDKTTKLVGVAQSTINSVNKIHSHSFQHGPSIDWFGEQEWSGAMQYNIILWLMRSYSITSEMIAEQSAFVPV